MPALHSFPTVQILQQKPNARIAEMLIFAIREFSFHGVFSVAFCELRSGCAAQ